MKYKIVINEFGIKFWYKEGTNILHREDGPAVEDFDRAKFWYINNRLHREDGPAVEYASGDKFWWIDGKLIDCQTQEEFERLVKLKAFW
jgi:hypothetical protein